MTQKIAAWIFFLEINANAIHVQLLLLVPAL